MAIIAVLASMLLPALSKARQKAMAITCLGNLKQVGFATISYGMENDDFVLPEDGSKRNMGGTSEMVWGYYARFHLGINVENPSVTNKYNTVIPENLRKGIIKCPMVGKPVTAFGYFSYGMISEYIGQNYPGLTFTKIKKASQVGYLMESVYAGKGAGLWTAGDTSVASENGMFNVHNDGRNISRARHGKTNTFFIDGHVESLTETYLIAQYARGGYGRDSEIFGTICLP